MKKNVLLFLLIFLKIASEANSPVFLGDPFIILYQGKYYAYGTQSPNGIAVYVSDDLYTWKIPENALNGLALHKDDVYGGNEFWAPEVYYIGKSFYMYFTADEHICVATSDKPEGPFVQAVKKPMISNEKCIDNSLFIDDDGKPYISFVRFNDGNNIWIAALNMDFQTLDSLSMKKCLHVSQPWEEVWPRVNEGPFVVKHNGTYFMTYSANSYESQFYGVGFATGENIFGPWVKYDGNPILQKPGNLSGVGHSAFFTDNSGQLRIVFHAHYSKFKIHPRTMHIGSVYFETVNGKEIIKIGDDIINPVILKDKK